MKKILKLGALVLVVSIALSGIALFLADEAFAITREGEPLEVDISPGASVKEAAALLKERGVIKSALWFRAYLALRGKNGLCSGGRYSLAGNLGYDGIYRELMKGWEREHVSVTVLIPEGSTVEDIIDIICVKHGISNKEEMLYEIENGDFSKYSFIKDIPSARKHRLEGYLYPDTYCFYSDCSAYAVIDKMLMNFSVKFDQRYKKACLEKGMSMDETVVLASIIAKEAKFVSDYGKVSSVFHNRLKSKSFGGRLESDATLVYALGRLMEPADKLLDSPYNSYRFGGLPIGPICNPDVNAFAYALYPDKTNYYYFVTGADGNILYASSYGAHKRNIGSVK